MTNPTADVDAVVVGAGHNGLVAATMLADAGWNVVVVEEQPRIGGAVYSDEGLRPGFVTDWFSAFYPLAVASPVLAALDLHDVGLRWSHSPLVLTHVFPDDRAAVLSRDLDVTAASVDSFAAGDGAAWRDLVAQFTVICEPLVDALFTTFPPVRPGVALARRLGVADLLRFARFAMLPVRRAGEELFRGEGARVLLAGNALHTDLSPDMAGSAVYGWLLAMLGQTFGFPVPVGGSGALTRALTRRLLVAGGTIRTGTPVAAIQVRDGAVRGVELAGGERIATRAVLASVDAPTLYGRLVDPVHLPHRLLNDLSRFQWDAGTVKVDWVLNGTIPWLAEQARTAGTVHLDVDLNGLTRYAASLATGQIPPHPFVLLGQMTTADPTRSPAGTESAWAYTHVPAGRSMTASEMAAHVDLIERIIERHAPGFRDLIAARRVLAPADLHDVNANLFHGAVNAGTAALHQQLIFRPLPGLGRPETPIDGLYLAGASAHPGGGVHGGPGANAARAALARAGRGGRLRRRAVDSMLKRIYPAG